MFKVNNKNTRTRCEICSKLTIRYQNDANGGLVGTNIFIEGNSFKPKKGKKNDVLLVFSIVT